MALNPLLLLVLDASMQSPEAPHTIRAETEDFLGETVTDAEILEAYRQLEALGLIEALKNDPPGQDWKVVRMADEPSAADLWFMATREGRKTVDREWEGTFPGRGGDG